MNEQINSLIQDLRRQTEYCTKEDLLKAADFLEELGDRCDELAADKGTYFRLYEALCIKVEADKKAKITQIRDTKFAELIVRECVNREQLLGAIARGWCSEKNSHKTMDPDLALAIFDEVERQIKQQFGVEE